MISFRDLRNYYDLINYSYLIRQCTPKVFLMNFIALACLAETAWQVMQRKPWVAAAIAVGGICLEAALAILLSSKVIIPKTNYQKGTGISTSLFLIQIFQETMQACLHGYKVDGVLEKIDHTQMKKKTISYGKMHDLIPVNTTYPTKFSVIIADTLDVILQRKQEGANPLGLNMANLYNPGGGVKFGCTAQEEAICRRSNYLLSLETQTYPMSEIGGIYSPFVQVFRKSDFTFMDDPEEVSLIAVAAYDLRANSTDRENLGLPSTGELTHDQLINCSKYKEGTKEKIRNMLRMAIAQEHTDLVLGALGCGAFKNPPEIVSRLFQEVFNEAEFKGRFKRVDFAILKLTDKDQNNIDEFQKMCRTLSKDNIGGA